MTTYLLNNNGISFVPFEYTLKQGIFEREFFMDKDKLNDKNKYINIFITAVIFVAVTVGFILIFAAVMYLIEGGYEYSPLFATISAAAGTLLSSMYLARKVGKKGLLTGGAVGTIIFLLLVIMAFVFNKTAIGVNTLFRFIIIMLSSLIGGVIGVNKNTNPKYI